MDATAGVCDLVFFPFVLLRDGRCGWAQEGQAEPEATPSGACAGAAVANIQRKRASPRSAGGRSGGSTSRAGGITGRAAHATGSAGPGLCRPSVRAAAPLPQALGGKDVTAAWRLAAPLAQVIQKPKAPLHGCSPLLPATAPTAPTKCDVEDSSIDHHQRESNWPCRLTPSVEFPPKKHPYNSFIINIMRSNRSPGFPLQPWTY